MPTAKPSTEVATARPHEVLIQQIQGQASLESRLGSSAAEVMANVTDNIAVAADEDALFAAANDGPGKIENFVGHVLRIESFSFLKSDAKYDGPLGVYVVMAAVSEDGEALTISTGATNIVTMMKRAEQLGLINPETDTSWRVRVVSRETGNGTLYTFAKP